MSRSRVTVMCGRHDPIIPVGVLVLPARPPLTSEQYDAYVRQWIDFLSTTAHPEWSAEQCRTKALKLARKNEISQTEVLYYSANGRLTRSGKWKSVQIVGVSADVVRSGARMFTFECTRCKQPKRIDADRLLEVVARRPGDVLLLADL